MWRSAIASIIRIDARFGALKFTTVAMLAVLFLMSASCRSNPVKRYPLTGTVVSIDKQSQSVVVNGNEVPGFMPAMAMPYKVKNAGDLDRLAPGDSITGDIVMQGTDYWLENVQVTQHSTPPPAPPGTAHSPSRGEAVPDFLLTNQSGQRIHLSQYRGKVLVVTFIYTRCPFPDYCPRISGMFAELNRQMLADPALATKTHLLSISFDADHDSPKVLRNYGLNYAGSQREHFFDHWEFAALRKDDLSRIAGFFGFTYVDEAGSITHSLSTTVIAPDGTIFGWYHGSDWQVSELMKDAAAAEHPSS